VTVVATAPCRADLAGGTLDIWPLGVLHEGSVTVNVALPVRVGLRLDAGAPAGVCELRTVDDTWLQLSRDVAGGDLTAAVCFWLRPAGGLAVHVTEQPPIGSGLGGSSSYAVALARAVLCLEGRSLGDRDLVALVRDLEARILKTPAGVQDHWAAVRGGVTALHLEPGGERVEELDVDPSWLDARMSVFNTGIGHHSGMVNWQVIRRRFDGDQRTVEALDEIAAAARRCCDALRVGDEHLCGEAIAAEWSARRRLAPEVCPPELERLEDVARQAGASAFKACGAGGGGSVLIWHAAGGREPIEQALAAAAPNGFMFPAGTATEGCRAQQCET
jgi:D-glycero-alpha-D-manno-heptose-7-phosphate kinase